MSNNEPADVEAARASAEQFLKDRQMLRVELPEDVLAYLYSAMAAYASEQCTALRRELADVKGERDRQYEENVNRIVMQAAAERDARNLREALAAIASVPDDAPNAPATLRSIIVRAKCALRVAEERKKPSANAEGPNPIGQSDQ